MMSDSSKRIQASTLRSRCVEEKRLERAADRWSAIVSRGTATEDGQESRGFPPVNSVHCWRNRAPRRFETLLHFKGFGGGVPQNTETAAVKPRVGSAS